MGAGLVLRDSQGSVLAAMSKRVPANLEALEAEAKAMEIAVQFAGETGLERCILRLTPAHLRIS